MLSDRSRFFALLLALGVALILVVALLWLVPAAHAGADGIDNQYQIECPADGNGSEFALELQIGVANDHPGRDEIVVVPANPPATGACIFTLETARDDYGNGAVGLPLITDTLVIRGEGIHVVFERQGTEVFRLLEATADLALENVTVRNGRTNASHRGGGILAHQSLTLTNVVLTGNVSYHGGGAYVGGSLTMSRTVVNNNEARSGNAAYGGGVWVEGDLAAATITVTGNFGDDAYGAGLYSAGDAHINGGWFAANEGVRGGGLYAAGDLTLADSAFYSNTAGSYGGGLLADGALSVLDSTFAHNEAGYGGGLYVETAGMNAQIADVAFEHNSASASGGGLFVLRHVEVAGSRFSGNEAAEGGGGGFITSGVISGTLFVQNAASGLDVDYAGGGLLILYDADIRSSRFLSNTAPSGAGVFLAHVPPGDVSLLVNNLWVDNDAIDGAAIFAGLTADEQGGGHAEINHSTIVRRVRNGGSAVHVVEGTANVTNNVIVRHSVGVSAGPQATSVASDYNLFFENLVRHAGVPSGANNLDGDPHFIDLAAGDYHLRFDSPAVDSGADLGLSADLDGVERPQRAGYDRGAYEYVNVPPMAAAETYTTTAAALLTIPAPGVLGNDGDFEGDALAAVLASGPDHGELALNADGSFTYTPAAGFTGTDAFTYWANDGYDGSSPAMVTLVVEAVRVYLPAVLSRP